MTALLKKIPRLFGTAALVTVAGLTIRLPAAQADVIGYKTWRLARVEEAKAALQRLQLDASIEVIPSLDPNEKPPAPAAIVDGSTAVATRAPLRSANTLRFEHRLDQARLNLEMAQDLTINDYFVLYLKPFKSKDAFLEAARKLSPDEMGELMLAYQKQLAGDAGDSQSQVSMMGSNPSNGSNSGGGAPRSAPAKSTK